MGLFGDKLAKDYLARGGDKQWNYKGDKWNLIDWLFGRDFKPSKPLTLYGVDKEPGMDMQRYKNTTLNYAPMKKYNPYVAEQYKNGMISDREAQQIINNGFVREWLTKGEHGYGAPTPNEDAEYDKMMQRNAVER